MAMNRATTAPRVGLALLSIGMLATSPAAVRAQDHGHKAGMVHTPGMTPPILSVAPTQGGQAGFAAIAEIVRMLHADSSTNWAKVNIERLRLHLVDMDLVTMRTAVTAANVPGGAVFTVRGTGDAVGAIQRMTLAHTSMVAAENGPRLSRTVLPNGVRLTILARDPANALDVARIRGLGFIGLLANGDHHGAHHLMIAQGASMSDHGH